MQLPGLHHAAIFLSRLNRSCARLLKSFSFKVECYQSKASFNHNTAGALIEIGIYNANLTQGVPAQRTWVLFMSASIFLFPNVSQRANKCLQRSNTRKRSMNIGKGVAPCPLPVERVVAVAAKVGTLLRPNRPQSLNGKNQLANLDICTSKRKHLTVSHNSIRIDTSLWELHDLACVCVCVSCSWIGLGGRRSEGT